MAPSLKCLVCSCLDLCNQLLELRAALLGELVLNLFTCFNEVRFVRGCHRHAAFFDKPLAHFCGLV